MSPRERENGTHEWRLEQLEERVDRQEGHIDSLRHWRTFLLGCWIIVSALGTYAVTFANGAVAEELKLLRQSVKQAQIVGPVRQ